MSLGCVLVLLVVVVLVLRSGVATLRRRLAVRGLVVSMMMLRVMVMRLVLAMAFRVVLAVSRSFALGALVGRCFLVVLLGNRLVS